MKLTHSLRVAANRGTTSAYIAGLLETAAERIDELEKEVDSLKEDIELIDAWSTPST